MMTAYYYDELGRNVMTIGAHSNVGFHVWERKYDFAGNEIMISAYKEHVRNDTAFNLYSYIRKYNKAEDLENDSLLEK